jgi:hypothetical protein
VTTVQDSDFLVCGQPRRSGDKLVQVGCNQNYLDLERQVLVMVGMMMRLQTFDLPRADRSMFALVLCAAVPVDELVVVFVG